MPNGIITAYIVSVAVLEEDTLQMELAQAQTVAITLILIQTF